MKQFFSALIILIIMASFSFAQNVKEPNVAGQFYSDQPDQLSTHIDKFFNAASIPPSSRDIKMIIAPHAGYVYSGGVAAYSFKSVSKQAVNTVVVLAPSHFFAFDGISIWQEGGFKTPLGVLAVDQDFAQKLVNRHNKFYHKPEVFEREHALEVELPFIQKTFTKARIVPVIMGQTTFELTTLFAKELDTLIGERQDVLVVVSTDMSHYHDDATARKMDAATLEVIKQLKAKQLYQLCLLRKLEMCGFIPVTTALQLAQMRNLSPKILKYANSGDITGDKNRVVGYTSVVFSGPGKTVQDSKDTHKAAQTKDAVPPLTLKQKKRLVDIAKQTIVEFVETGKAPEFKEKDKRLLETEGAFVTIHKKGRLRGCIGNVIATKPLYETVRDVAVSAASQDPRFNPVDEKELKDLDVEVSVLSKPRRITNVEEIKVGVHGVILYKGPDHHGLFLPQVATEWGWNREEFLSNLCVHKANLPADAWKDPETHIEIFSADVFSEKDVQ